MSRSYKHFPCWKIGSRYNKKFANKRIRHLRDLNNFAYYKRCYPQYDIYECIFIYKYSTYVKKYNAGYFCSESAWRRNLNITIIDYNKYYKWK